MLVSWTSQSRAPLNYQEPDYGDTTGHVGLFRVGPSGVQMIASVKLNMCRMMGGVTVSQNCSVLAALCVSREGPDAFANFKNDIVAEATVANDGNPPFGWYEES